MKTINKLHDDEMKVVVGGNRIIPGGPSDFLEIDLVRDSFPDTGPACGETTEIILTENPGVSVIIHTCV